MKLSEIVRVIWRKVLAIDEEKVAFFHNYEQLVKSKHYHRLYRDFKNVGKLSFYDSEQDKIYLKTNNNIFITTDKYYAIVLEIFVHEVYSLPPYVSETDFVVFDMGMNRAYTSLYFADMPHCQHVYAWEIDTKTYSFAQENLQLNVHLSNKITSYNFGLWNDDEEIDLGSDGIDGHSAISDVKQTNTMQTFSRVKVKNASKELSNIFKSIDNKFSKVLKIDVEGSEYVIFENLYKNNILQQFDLIIGEYHDGIDGLKPYLSDFNCIYHNSIDGKLGAFTFVKK